jgi:hypothetical protein
MSPVSDGGRDVRHAFGGFPWRGVVAGGTQLGQVRLQVSCAAFTWFATSAAVAGWRYTYAPS